MKLDCFQFIISKSNFCTNVGTFGNHDNWKSSVKSNPKCFKEYGVGTQIHSVSSKSVACHFVRCLHVQTVT